MVAWSQYVPTLRVSGGYDWFSFTWPPEDESWSLRLTASLPLFTGFTREADVARAEAERRIAEAEARDAVLLTRARVEDAVGQIDTATRRIDIARRALAVAEEDLRVIEERYRARRRNDPRSPDLPGRARGRRGRVGPRWGSGWRWSPSRPS